MDVIIIGAGGHGKVVADILRAAGTHRPIGFIDADASLVGAEVAGIPVLGAPNLLPRLRQKVRHALVAVGDNATRVRYANLLSEQGFTLVNAVHPTASIAPSASVGRNVVVAAQAAICAEAVIGDSVIVNTSAVVDHECQISIGVHICPGAVLAGRVRVGQCGFVGIGANVIQCLSIGERAIVGAGAVVIADVPADATAVGVPAKIIKTVSRLLAAG